ncbi:MAG: hypothetical protein ACLPT6_09730 [Desulfobaccales bacterium]
MPVFDPPAEGWMTCTEDVCDNPPNQEGRGDKAKIWCNPTKKCTEFNKEKCQCRLFKRAQPGPGETVPGPWEWAANEGDKIDKKDFTDYLCVCTQKEVKKKLKKI